MIIYQCDICGWKSTKASFLRPVEVDWVRLQVCDRCYHSVCAILDKYNDEFHAKYSSMVDKFQKDFIDECRQKLNPKYKEEMEVTE